MCGRGDRHARQERAQMKMITQRCIGILSRVVDEIVCRHLVSRQIVQRIDRRHLVFPLSPVGSNNNLQSAIPCARTHMFTRLIIAR